MKEKEITENNRKENRKTQGRHRYTGGQRAAAMAGVILLLALYLVTLLSAIFTTPATQGLFRASIFSTVAVPFMMYGYILVYRLLKKKGEEIQQKEGDAGREE